MTHQALRRVLRRLGGPAVLDGLAGGLSGSDLTTFLLEVFRRRASALTPADVLRRYRADRFVRPAPVSFAALRHAEDTLLAALPSDTEMLALAPLVPLATHSATGAVDPRNVVAAIRGTEVAADPTNGLALEAAVRRTGDPKSTAPVRLAAIQRVTRAQLATGPAMFAHFQLFALVTAGRDTGNRSFERRHLAEHLGFAARALRAAGAEVEIALTCLDQSGHEIAKQVRENLDGVVDDPGRTSGRGYYQALCFKISVFVDGKRFEIGDGGFVDWTRRLTGNRKERLLITGLGLDRLALALV